MRAKTGNALYDKMMEDQDKQDALMIRNMQKPTAKPVFAIDVGGVLASKQHDGVPREGALEAVAELNQYFELWVVSQCGKARALATRAWLREWAFPIPKERQVYVPFSETKDPVLRDLKAIYFVDDRMKHVLPALKLSRMYRVFHLPEHGFERLVVPASEKYVLVKSWEEIVQSTRNVAKECNHGSE